MEITIRINGRLYRTDGNTIHLDAPKQNGCLYVKQLNDELREEIKKKLAYKLFRENRRL